jgi:hypothetical protein
MPGPYNFETQPKFLRNLMLSLNKQAAWNTALADAALTYRQRFDGAAVLEQKITRRSDIGYAGKGTAFATNGQITSYDTELSGFKVELAPWMAGWLFAFLMGKETVTGVAAPYTHVFTFDESTRTAVPTTLYVEDTEDVKYKVPDFCINDVTITINETGAVMAEMTGMGTGRLVLAALAAALPAVPAETYLLNSDAVLNFGLVGAPQPFIGRHISTTFKCENQLAVHRAPGGGLYGIFVRKGNPKFSISSSFAAKDTDDVYTRFANNTACAFTMGINSGASAQMQISIPQTQLKTNKIGFVDEMIVWQIEADETTCYQAAGVPPVSVQVINDVPAYLAVAA